LCRPGNPAPTVSRRDSSQAVTAAFSLHSPARAVESTPRCKQRRIATHRRQDGAHTCRRFFISAFPITRERQPRLPITKAGNVIDKAALAPRPVAAEKKIEKRMRERPQIGKTLSNMCKR
jgi:hypothetical protein